MFPWLDTTYFLTLKESRKLSIISKGTNWLTMFSKFPFWALWMLASESGQLTSSDDGANKIHMPDNTQSFHGLVTWNHSELTGTSKVFSYLALLTISHPGHLPRATTSVLDTMADHYSKGQSSKLQRWQGNISTALPLLWSVCCGTQPLRVSAFLCNRRIMVFHVTAMW